MSLYSSSLLVAETPPHRFSQSGADTPNSEPRGPRQRRFKSARLIGEWPDVLLGLQISFEFRFFEDEFANINPDIWGYEIQRGGFGTGSFEWTTNDPKNAFVDAEGLHIVPTITTESTDITPAQLLNGYTLNLTTLGTCTSPDPFGSCSIYSNITSGAIVNPVRSARLTTQGKKTLKYGRVEVIAKMPQGDWLWPAIWMMPESSVYGTWPQSGEIDIVESKGNDGADYDGGRDTVISALHWGPVPQVDAFYKTDGKHAIRRTDYSEQYNTYGLEWSEKYIFTYLNSRLLQVFFLTFQSQGFSNMWERGGFSQDIINNSALHDPWSQTGRANTPFDEDFFLIMNVAVGSTNGYFPDKVGNKPWGDASLTAPAEFWNASSQWLPTWGNGTARGLTVKSVKMWSQGACGSPAANYQQTEFSGQKTSLNASDSRKKPNVVQLKQCATYIHIHDHQQETPHPKRCFSLSTQPAKTSDLKVDPSLESSSLASLTEPGIPASNSQPPRNQPPVTLRFSLTFAQGVFALLGQESFTHNSRAGQTGGIMAPTLVYPALATFLLLISLPLSETRYVRHERSLISPRSGTWSYVGCYTDSVGARTLPSNPGTTGGTAALTVELCTSTCQGLGYVFAGMEYAGQCFCGNAFLNGGGPAPDGETGCDMACSGNATETCGGPNRLSLWDFNDAINATSSSSSSATASATSSSSSAAATGPPGWSELGCYTDSVGARALTDQLYTIPGASMTVEACTAACKTAGYPLAGVEYSDECYCGNTISNSNVLSTDGGCTMTCNGNTAEICGGPNRINIYSISGASSSGSATASGSASSVSASSSATATASTGWNSLGCYTDAVGARALVNQQYTIPGASMTVEACEAACKTLGYTLAGVEYSDECYCANSISNANAPATDGCTMTCNGNTAEICGGPNRINIYSYNSGATSSSASGTASATGSVTGTSTSVTASSTSPVATGLPSGWSYKGCWVDNQYGRILGYAQPNVASLTIESCIATCSGLGYSVAGMEYYTQCYCDNNIIQAGTLATSDSDCNTPCGGNSAEICGGGNLMSIYSNETTVDVIPLPTVQKTDLPGNWTYQGCLLDNAVTRTFPYQLEFLNNNTAENCLSQCQLFGYGAGGMEYGQQCFCGDVQNAIDAGATLQPEDTCNMLCSGNSSYYCGGPSRIQYYTWSGTPLESWDFKSGPEAGEYQFLIGGVIIPLISQPAINGKIAFLEKFGTEPANNSPPT
ncbi:hypothetical protein G7Y89_g6540 [Cudoniella acicularis]|uniref:Uncharacterized protein n=1 Tax=Cudoniella acicularis TaxID=354080 RepID=A0A8H4W4N4_9HELO|nr:hypothetical protein G7Y89_g6540 [Cudoniella acicularis]